MFRLSRHPTQEARSEGGGQAYYELGVADSGTLIGVPCADLEDSLETLLSLPRRLEPPLPTVAALADEESKCIHSNTGQWTRKMQRRHAAVSGCSSSATTTEAETDLFH